MFHARRANIAHSDNMLDFKGTNSGLFVLLLVVVGVDCVVVVALAAAFIMARYFHCAK